MLTAAMTLMQEHTTDRYRGRVFGALGAVEGVAIVTGTVAAGVLAHVLGIVAVLSVQGAGYVAAGILVLALLQAPQRFAPRPTEPRRCVAGTVSASRGEYARRANLDRRIEHDRRHPRRRARQVLEHGMGLTEAQTLDVLRLEDERVSDALELAHEVRMRWCGPEIEVEGIVSVKTGGCPEDCHFCSQSGALTRRSARRGWTSRRWLRRRWRRRRRARRSSVLSRRCAGPMRV